eukprot:TRINITY_DN3671_c0_g1_i1.p1 TRINITY_DN3671_c0_g1~~TRINITY_DN3671_c0_g1_i1.p1  ORF type:complete len:293 (-),score=68.83 TRINITY_DN3671_c0_g1_i1:41-919(-)
MKDLDFSLNTSTRSGGAEKNLIQNTNASSDGYGGPQSTMQSMNIEPTNKFDFTKAAHPWACFFHFIFKVGAALSYLFLYFIYGKVTTFIFVVLFSSFDFWTVKNITGRLLVGLRWWNDIKEDGTETWVFESYDMKVEHNPIDKHIFWWSQGIATAFWAFILFINIITFTPYWGIASGIAFGLTGTNFYGYYKCSKDHQNKMNDMIRGTASGMVANAVMGNARKVFGFQSSEMCTNRVIASTLITSTLSSVGDSSATPPDLCVPHAHYTAFPPALSSAYGCLLYTSPSPRDQA